MASVYDVSAYILQAHGTMTAMKLQKLVYYSQAWSLVWDEEPLFPERIEAWANGPVSPDLFLSHRGEFQVSAEPRGNPRALTRAQRETVNAVLRDYGERSAQWLSALTHREDPWLNARDGLDEGERCNVEITHGAMADYYGIL